MQFQKTLKKSVTIQGVGLHSGKTAKVKILPSEPHTGISFIRTDIPGSSAIQANFRNISNTQLATTLGQGTGSISTVEHLMAALAGVGIDNARIEVDGPEVPIVDGSAKPFYQGLLAAGIFVQSVPRTIVSLRRRIEIRVDDKLAVAEPMNGFEIHSSIEWKHPVIGKQSYTYKEGTTSFEEIMDARTFGFLFEVEKLQKMGLARGGSLENAVVLDHEKVLNQDGLRYENEFVRHKTLDALGDFKLAGYHLQARIQLHRSGHEMHYQLLAAIFKDFANFEVQHHAKGDIRESLQLGDLVASAAHVAAG